MAWQEQVYDRLQRVSGGFHAVPAQNPNPLKTLPAMHRFFNAGGMVVGFIGLNYITDIMYGHKINGSQYHEIPKEKVPFILRPLHGIIKANPHSDRKRDKELTILHNLIPSIGGAAGAIAGSTYFFSQNGTNKRINGLIAESGKRALTAGEKAAVESYKQGKTWRIVAGMSAWPSSASGLTGLLYGTSLNTAFWLGNNSKKPIPEPTKGRIALAAAEIAVVLGGLGFIAHKLLKKREAAVAKTGEKEDLSDVKAQQYVDTVHQKHSANEEKGLLNGKVYDFAKWISDAALQFVPVHRIWSSIGLTAGGTTGLQMGRLLTGKGLAGGPGFKNESLPKVFQSLNGVLAQNPEKYSPMTNKFLGISGKFIFAAFCAVGVMIGSKHAYKSTYRRNDKPDSLEDYIARVRQHHGDKMIPFIASSSIFGSAAGTYLVPLLPGINYGASLSYRVISMQDRNITSPGLDKLTGNSTSSYFGLREGLDYMCKYAVRNPAERPEQFEYLAYTLMGPLAHAAKVDLKGEHIKKFVDKMNDIRDKYWVEGGVPQDKHDELAKELKENFTGKGLDKTLYECGIDSMNIEFHQIGGLIGKFATMMGAKKKIEQEQERYQALASEWRQGWDKNEPASGDKPDEGKGAVGTETVKHGAPQKSQSAIDNEFVDIVGNGGFNPDEADRIEKSEKAFKEHDADKTVSQETQWAKSEKAARQKPEPDDKKSVAFNGAVTSQNGVSKTVDQSSVLNSVLSPSPVVARI